MSMHQELLRTEVERMDAEVNKIMMLIEDALPRAHTDLFLKTITLGKLSITDHPIDRLVEYRMLAGKLDLTLSRLVNITNSLQRRVLDLSDRAQKLNKIAAWTPELIQEMFGGGQ
jgi:hypothetical protein